jgi:hypothetical protein
MKNFRIFLIQQVQIVKGCDVILLKKTEKFGTLVLKKCYIIHRKNAFVLKSAFRISLKIYTATYDYFYLLDSEKSKVYFLSWFNVEK